jgi:hypothetical protein
LGTTDHCQYYSTWNKGKISLRKRGKAGGNRMAAFSTEGDLGRMKKWMKKIGGSLLITEAHDHSNDKVYSSFGKYFNDVLILEIFRRCRNTAKKGKISHICSPTSSSKRRPSPWRLHRSAYQVLLGKGPFDMILVKG